MQKERIFCLTWTTPIDGVTVISAAVETVVMVSITDDVIALALHILDTHGEGLALASVRVTEILSFAVSVIVTLAGVVSEVTDGGGVLAVETTVVTSWCDVNVN